MNRLITVYLLITIVNKCFVVLECSRRFLARFCTRLHKRVYSNHEEMQIIMGWLAQLTQLGVHKTTLSTCGEQMSQLIYLFAHSRQQLRTDNNSPCS